MCHKLIQVYACGHEKEICTTACPHALASANTAPASPPSTSSTPNLQSPTSQQPAFRFLAPVNTHPTTRSPSPTPSISRYSIVASITLISEACSPVPDFCTYYFPRPLPRSQQPCLECYTKKEWAHLGQRLVMNYRQNHPLEKAEDAERLTGLRDLKVRYGGEEGGEDHGKSLL